MAELTSLQINGNTVQDYIIAQGTSGEWFYRKWNSGYCECWATHVYESFTYTSAGGMHYCELPAISLPFTINIKATQVNCMSGGYCAFASKSGPIGSRTSINALVFQWYNDAVASVRIAWYVYGTWK